MEQKRILWIDGLRGIACILIVLHHFILGYYPAAYLGSDGVSHMTSGADTAFAQSPLGFFVNGDVWVTVFCVVSGFVIANQVWRMTDGRQYSKALLKRYPRLVLPVFAVSVIIYLMLQLGLFWNLQTSYITGSEWLSSYYQDKTDLRVLITDSLIYNWLIGHRLVYSNAFWMLKDLFAGSYVAYILAYIGKDAKRRMLWVYLFVFIIFFPINTHQTDFVIGVLTAFLYGQFGKYFRSHQKIFVPIGLLLILIGFFLGGYPTGMVPTNGYRYLAAMEGMLPRDVYYHRLAVFSLFFGICMISGLQKALGTAPCRFLGKISYAVYLIHIPVLFSVTAWIFMQLYQKMGRYNLTAVTTLFVSLAVILLLAWLFWRFVETYCMKFTDWLVGILFR